MNNEVLNVLEHAMTETPDAFVVAVGQVDENSYLTITGISIGPDRYAFSLWSFSLEEDYHEFTGNEYSVSGEPGMDIIKIHWGQMIYGDNVLAAVAAAFANELVKS